MDKNIVYVPVEISLLPTKEGRYITIVDESEYLCYFNGERFEVDVFTENRITAWLKPISIDELVKEKSIEFLDSIRDYEHENKSLISNDERTSEELYNIHTTQFKNQ